MRIYIPPGLLGIPAPGRLEEPGRRVGGMDLKSLALSLALAVVVRANGVCEITCSADARVAIDMAALINRVQALENATGGTTGGRQAWIHWAHVSDTSVALTDIMNTTGYVAFGGAMQDWKLSCNVASSTGVMMMVMGDFVDYFRPTAGSDFCQMVQGDDFHEWSYDGITFHSLDGQWHSGDVHFGGATRYAPAALGDTSGRQYVPFWGKRSAIAPAGCCELTATDTPGWGKPFDLYVHPKH